MGLDDEHVGASHRLGEAGPDLAVGEVNQVGFTELHSQVGGDLLGQDRVGPAGEQVQLPGRGQLHGAGSPGRGVRGHGSLPVVMPSSEARTGDLAGPHFRAGRKIGPRAHLGVGPDLGVAGDGRSHDSIATNLAVGELGVRTQLGTRLYRRVPLQVGARVEHHVGTQLDGGIHVRGFRIDHRHPSAHPPLVDAGPQLGLGQRQLVAVVDPRRLYRIVDDHRYDRVAGVVQHGDGIGQVVLALRVVRGKPAQRRSQDRASENVDGRVDFLHRHLVLASVGLLDYPGHAVVLVPDHATVTTRVIELGGQHGRRRLGPAVGSDQRRQRGRPQKRSVARQDHNVTVVDVVVREGRQRHENGIARAPLHPLLNEVEVQAGRWLLPYGFGDAGRPVADYDNGPLERKFGQCIQHVQDHGPTAQTMQRLRTLGTHPGPLAGGENYSCRRRIGGHGSFLSICRGLTRHHFPRRLWPPSPGRPAVAGSSMAERLTLDQEAEGSSPSPPAEKRKVQVT